MKPTMAVTKKEQAWIPEDDVTSRNFHRLLPEPFHIFRVQHRALGMVPPYFFM